MYTRVIPTYLNNSNNITPMIDVRHGRVWFLYYPYIYYFISPPAPLPTVGRIVFIGVNAKANRLRQLPLTAHTCCYS